MNHSFSDKIFIIDDDEFNAKVIQWQLEYMGCDRIEIFSDPKSAIEAIEGSASAPAVIFTEFNLPYMNGERFLNEITRYHAGTKSIIITSDPSTVPENVRYPVYHKNPYRIMDAAEDVVDILRCIIRPLFVKCPLDKRNHSCPFFPMRTLPGIQKAFRIMNIDAKTAQRMIRFHQSCFRHPNTC